MSEPGDPIGEPGPEPTPSGSPGFFTPNNDCNCQDCVPDCGCPVECADSTFIDAEALQFSITFPDTIESDFVESAVLPPNPQRAITKITGCSGFNGTYLIPVSILDCTSAGSRGLDLPVTTGDYKGLVADCPVTPVLSFPFTFDRAVELRFRATRTATGFTNVYIEMYVNTVSSLNPFFKIEASAVNCATENLVRVGSYPCPSQVTYLPSGSHGTVSVVNRNDGPCNE